MSSRCCNIESTTKIFLFCYSVKERTRKESIKEKKCEKENKLGDTRVEENKGREKGKNCISHKEISERKGR